MSVEANIKYIADFPHSYLAKTVELLHSHDRSLFISTCCFITVEAFVYKNNLKACAVFPFISLEDCFKNQTKFCSIDLEEHAFIITEKYIIQSYYK